MTSMRAFGNPFAEIRYEIMAGQFGRGFEPHPSRPLGPEPEQPGPGKPGTPDKAGWFSANFEPDPSRQHERDIHGNELDVDR